MKKLVKILAVLAVLVVGMMVIGTVALHILLPPEKAKALVLQKLSAQLKREVDVSSVSVGLLSGLELSKLRISESPNFSKGTFISSDLFSLKVALTPLLFKKVIVREILLKHPEVTVVRMADGKTFNFSDLTESTTPTQLASKTTPAASHGAPSVPGQAADGASNDSFPFLLVVSRAEIQKGIVHFVDKSPAKQSAEIDPLDLVLKNVSLTSPFSVQTAVHITSQGHELGVHLAGQADLAKGTFKIASSDVETGPIKATISGVLSQLKSASPACKLHIETNNIPIRDALKMAPAPLPEGVILDGKTSMAIDVSGTADNAQFEAKWAGTDLLVAKGDDFAKPTGVPLEVSLSGSRSASGETKVNSFTAKLGENSVTGSGTYKPLGKDAAIDVVAKGTNWAVQDLAKLSPLAAPYHATGTFSFTMHATGMASNPQVVLETSANIASADYKQDYVEGKNLQLIWHLTGITPDLAKVNGTASLKHGPGTIKNVDKIASSSKMGKILLAPLDALAKLQDKGVLKQVPLPSLSSIPFDSIVGDYVITSGVMNIKTFNLNSQDLAIEDTGTVGLAGAQPIHMNVVMKLAAGSVGGTLGAVLQDSSGRPTVKFLATGSVANPQVKLDLQDTEKKAVQQVGQELLKNPNVQNAINNLKGLFH